MRRAPLLLLLVLTATSLSGCFMSRMKRNVPLSPEIADRLVPGTSTADDVVALLGAPSDVVQLGRRSAWRYEHIQTKRAALFLLVVSFMNEDTKEDRIWVFFDEQGVLTHVGSSFQAELADFAMPWQDEHELELEDAAGPDAAEAAEAQAETP